MSNKERNCRDCQQCCIIYEIDGIDKKAREPCPHLDPGVGCKIYEERLPQCREFECMWIRGYGEFEDNPKISGVMVHQRESNLDPSTIYVASEIWKNAYKNKRAIKAMDNLSRELNSKIIQINFASDRVYKVYTAEGVE